MTRPSGTPARRLVAIDDEDELPLVYALARAIDDLEARALVADRDGDLGRRSAEEYRADTQRLARIAAVLGFESGSADPEGHTFTWGDEHYAIAGGTPVRLVPVPPLQRLLERITREGQAGSAPARALARALASPLGDRDTDDEHGHRDQATASAPRGRPAAEIVSRRPPRAPHRLAPGCERPRPDRRERGGGGRGC